jgi:hypothetical protein
VKMHRTTWQCCGVAVCCVSRFPDSKHIQNVAESSTDAPMVNSSTGYCVFDPILHQFEGLTKVERGAKLLTSEIETLARLKIYSKMSETAISIAEFALGFNNSGSAWAQDAAIINQTEEVIEGDAGTAEENGKLRHRVKELESLLE